MYVFILGVGHEDENREVDRNGTALGGLRVQGWGDCGSGFGVWSLGFRV